MRDKPQQPFRNGDRELPDGAVVVLAVIAWMILIAGIVAGVALERWVL